MPHVMQGANEGQRNRIEDRHRIAAEISDITIVTLHDDAVGHQVGGQSPYDGVGRDIHDLDIVCLAIGDAHPGVGHDESHAVRPGCLSGQVDLSL